LIYINNLYLFCIRRGSADIIHTTIIEVPMMKFKHGQKVKLKKPTKQFPAKANLVIVDPANYSDQTVETCFSPKFDNEVYVQKDGNMFSIFAIAAGELIKVR